MATTTTFRVALQATLSTALGTEFVGGILAEPQTNKSLGCVWHEGKRPQARDSNNEEVYYRVRWFPLWKQNQGETKGGLNVTALEQAEEDLQAALRAVLVPHGDGFFLISETTIDYAGQFVEAQLVGYQRNLGARGG